MYQNMQNRPAQASAEGSPRRTVPITSLSPSRQAQASFAHASAQHDAQLPPPTASVGSRASAAAGGAVDYGDYGDEHLRACTLCEREFTKLFRRHHCRSCNRLVCGDCSPHFMRLPQFPDWGKVRVCIECTTTIQQQNTECKEEDLAENQKVNEHLKAALKKMLDDSESYKRMLLKLETVATGDPSALDRFAAATDQGAPEFALGALRERVRRRWTAQQSKLADQVGEAARLQQEEVWLKEHLREAEQKAASLRAEQEALEIQQRDLVLVHRDIDEWERQNMLLRRARDDARRDVRRLEEQKKAVEEELTERAQAHCCCRRSRGARAVASSAGDGVQRWVVSTGRREAQSPFLDQPPSRLEQCRRSLGSLFGRE